MPASFSAWDSLPIAITQKAFNETYQIEERERKQSAELNKDFYYGKQEKTVQILNDDVDPITLNLTKPVMAKRCSMLYSRPLVREYEGPSSSINYLEEVYRDNHIDSLLSTIDLYSELTGSVLVHPMLDDSKSSGIKLQIFDGTQFSAVSNPDDPNIADAIALVKIVEKLSRKAPINAEQYVQPQVEKEIIQQIWTNQSVTLYEGQTSVSSEPNELGFLPFVNFKGEEVHNQYIGFPTATIVRKMNNQINNMLTLLGYTIKMQAGTPVVFSGFKSGETVVVHPGRAINIPDGAMATVLDLKPKIKETLDMVMYLEDRLYSSSSVPKISVEGGEGESGRELMVRWFPLLKVFEEKSNRFQRYELELANMILTIAGYDPIEDLTVSWPEESLLPFSTEEDNLERDIRLNIKSPIDEIKRRYPHLSEIDAEAEYLTNKSQNEGLL